MRVLCVFGQHNYGDPRRGESYEYVNFLPTLRRLGHEVLFLESWNRSCHYDFRELNEALLRTVEQEQPDIIFAVLMHYEIWLETWEILRDAGIAATLNWTTDDSWKYSQFSRLVAPALHAFTTTYPAVYPRYLHDGISHVLLTQWAANAFNLQQPLPAAECQYAISFVGTAHGKRSTWVNALRQRGLEVTCFGHGWQRGSVAAADIPRIIRNSVISLNFANGASMLQGLRIAETKQIKARTFEVPGAGGFLLTEWADGLDQYYTPGKEMAIFNNLDELEQQIRFYLAHPAERDNVAQAGYERTSAEHTYDRRLAEVFDFALSQRAHYFARRGMTPTVQIDWIKFAYATQRHIVDRKFLSLRRALVASCSTVWGPLRGPRAARRLVFELSWRLVGAYTYSSAGWPGRMFYEAS